MSSDTDSRTGSVEIMARDMTHNGRRTGRKPGNRKQYARERKLVKSSRPLAEQPAKCKACKTETTKGKLRLGYCSTCWTSEA